MTHVHSTTPTGFLHVTGTVTGGPGPRQASPWTWFDDLWTVLFDISCCTFIVLQVMRLALLAFPDVPTWPSTRCADILWTINCFIAFGGHGRLRYICAHFMIRERTMAKAMTDTIMAPETLYKSPNRGGSEPQ
jgi:hypothetical protein